MIAVMEQTIFCLLLPGDSVSSRRMAEIILAGCIPVFIGPPYHNTPLSDYIDYRAASIFLHVDEMTELAMNREVYEEPDENSSAEDLFDSRWWIPTTDFRAQTVRLKLDGILDYLMVRSQSHILICQCTSGH